MIFPILVLVCFPFSLKRFSTQGRNSEPRPIVLQILFAYGFSAMMDLPNFFKYEIKDCSNKTSEDAPLEKDCWSFVEVMSWK